MAYPTIPTAAAGRLLSTRQANTTATRTFPSLSSLTKNAGDLLIAIVVGYQTSTGTDAAFSGWGGGFTEVADRASSTTMAIGVAYKWSSGSETGTFTVTQAGTITGHAVMFLLAIPGAHSSTPPEVSTKVNGTSSNATPSALDPAAWGAEDTLWLELIGWGEVSTTGSATGISGVSTNYGNAETAVLTADAAGGVEATIAFRQRNAASEQPDTGFSVDTSNARHSVVTIAVRPAPTVEAYEGGSTADMIAAAEGAGAKAAQGGATASVLVTATGAGEVGSFDLEGGSTADVIAAAEGAGAKASSSGVQAELTAAAEGAGAKASSSGAQAELTATAESAGAKAAQGGATASVLVTATGAGEVGGLDQYSGGSVALLVASGSGSGSKLVAAGASAAVIAHAEAAGAKASGGASVATIIVTATGAGTALTPPPPDWLVWLWRAVRRRRTWAR